MQKDRLTAFSDGVIAVIITIMVLELRPPRGADLHSLIAVLGPFSIYALSFVYVGIYWNNHHHFFHLVRTVNGTILWANMNLLFWLSLIPFATAWMGNNLFSPIPTALYGVALLLPTIAWFVMQSVIIKSQGAELTLARALGSDLKGKITPILYVLGIGLSFVQASLADGVYAAVAMIWLIPDKRVEARVRQ